MDIINLKAIHHSMFGQEQLASVFESADGRIIEDFAGLRSVQGTRVDHAGNDAAQIRRQH